MIPGVSAPLSFGLSGGDGGSAAPIFNDFLGTPSTLFQVDTGSQQSIGFDLSNWLVNFNGTQNATATNSHETTQRRLLDMGLAVDPSRAVAETNWLTWALIGGAVWLMTR